MKYLFYPVNCRLFIVPTLIWCLFIKNDGYSKTDARVTSSTSLESMSKKEFIYSSLALFVVSIFVESFFRLKNLPNVYIVLMSCDGVSEDYFYNFLGADGDYI